MVGDDDEEMAAGESATEASAQRPAQPPRGDMPAWWIRAVALEAANQLEAAEQTIMRGVDHIGAGASVAEMYRLRMHRLEQAGDRAGAIAAFAKAHDWIGTYASWATSGGEGAALSLERDRFRAQLVSEFGSNPLE